MQPCVEIDYIEGQGGASGMASADLIHGIQPKGRVSVIMERTFGHFPSAITAGIDPTTQDRCYRDLCFDLIHEVGISAKAG